MTRVVSSGQDVGLEERTAVEGETPLTLAVKAGLLPNVRSLLEHGALPHNDNSMSESPLLLGNTERSACVKMADPKGGLAGFRWMMSPLALKHLRL